MQPCEETGMVLNKWLIVTEHVKVSFFPVEPVSYSQLCLMVPTMKSSSDQTCDLLTEEVLQEWGPLQSLQMTHECAAYNSDISCVRFEILMASTISFIVSLGTSSCSVFHNSRFSASGLQLEIEIYIHIW